MGKERLFYRESGRINPIGMIISVCVCVVTALCLGYIYAVITIFIPIIYLNFLITFGFGLVLAFVIRLVIRLSHNRNKKSQYIMAFALGFLAVVFQWAAYILYVLDDSIPSIAVYLSDFYLVILPQNFFPILAEINEIGLWSVGGFTLIGFSLSLIWILEAIAIIGLPIVAVYKTKVYPYSELLCKWYPKYTLNRDFESVAGLTRFLDYLVIDAVTAILDLEKGLGFRHSKIHIFYHKAENKQYLSLEKVFIEGRGKGKRKSDIVINNFEIDKNTAQLILEKFSNKKERVDIF